MFEFYIQKWGLSLQLNHKIIDLTFSSHALEFSANTAPFSSTLTSHQIKIAFKDFFLNRLKKVYIE